MLIKSVTIHNFRSIAHQTIILSAYSLLVGPNNAGKSNIIDALRMFYEKDIKFDYDRDFPKFARDDQESFVEVCFVLTPEENETLKAEYRTATLELVLRKWFAPSDRAKQGPFGYENGALSSTPFYGAKNVSQAKVGSVVYIPAVTALADHTKLSGPSALRDLINDIFKPIIRTSQSFATLSGQFAAFGDGIKNESTADARSLNGLATEINKGLVQWGAEFRLDVTAPTEDDIIKNLISHTVRDKALGADVDSTSFGHGFQRHLIFTLLKISAAYGPTRPEPKKKDFSPDFELLLYEEPEAFLHPPQQEILNSSLASLVTQPGRQVLVATHSPLFVSCNAGDIPRLALVHKEGIVTTVKQFTASDLGSLFSGNEEIRRLLESGALDESFEPDAELEAMRHFLWLNPERCALFFADMVLIVEGKCEQVLINHFLRSGAISSDRWVYVLDCEGKYNVHRFMSLLGGLGISHSVLYDGDANKTDKAKATHNALAALITNSRNSRTVSIDTFAEDLEECLQFRLSNRKDRWKASKIFLAAQNGTIRADRLQFLQQKVVALLTPELPA